MVWDSAFVSSSAFSGADSRDDDDGDDDDALSIREATKLPMARFLRSVLSEELGLRVLAREDTPHLSQVFPEDEVDISSSSEQFAFSVAGDVEVYEEDRTARGPWMSFTTRIA